MPSLSSIPRRVLFVVAIIFGASLTLYTGIWLYYIRSTPQAYAGIHEKLEYKPYVTVQEVLPGSPAEKAGLRHEDRILSVNGYPETLLALPPALAKGSPGDVVTLRVQRPGQAEPFDMQLTLGPPPAREPIPLVRELALRFISYYPVPFLIVGLSVLFLRLQDRNAWLLALMFAGFIAAAPLAFLEGFMPPGLRHFALSYMILVYATLPAIFYWFFATFPVSSPIDRKFPRLKYWLLAIVLAGAIPFAITALATGSLHTAVAIAAHFREPVWLPMLSICMFGCFALGLASLIWNAVEAPTPNDRRKIQVMFWGTIASVGPLMLAGTIGAIRQKDYTEYPFWFTVGPIIALVILPLSFAYAVVKHRVLEIPVLLKRSARYFLVQRGFLLLILLAGVAATLLLARGLEQYFPERSRMAVPSGAALGIFLVWGGTQMQSRVTRRLDRAFFRSAYDTRQILMDLATNTRNALNREQLAELLRHEIDEALHPATLAVYFREGNEFITTEDVPEDIQRLPTDLPVLEHMRERGQTWEIIPSPDEAPALAILQSLQPECLVPMMGRDGQLLGLAILGPKLSEESYSGEDKRLLDSVANQAGVALENIALAQSMAERMEADRRAAQEMDIARQVQAKLLPQKSPVLKTIDYAGACIQARAVGGDYYDFLDLGEGRVGFVLADVAGKGISAALLMANLQAHLRSQSAIVSHDFSQTLERVNRMFFESTESNKYATLFIGVYEDQARRLRYVNCGHNPPVILRGEQVERLHSTATVLGMFEEWHCEVAETGIHPADILAICTDGVLEATNTAGEEFGEEGLVAALLADRRDRPQDMLESVIAAVKQFAPGEQADDLTLIIAKANSD